VAAIENIRSVDVRSLRTQPVTQATPEAPSERQAIQTPGSQQEEPSQNSTKPESASSPSYDTVSNAVTQMNRFLNALQKDISFFFDEASGRNGVKVVDRQTGEVLKQIPPEEVLKTAARIREMVGALLDERA
jgi:flagellar protein FlaG